MFDHQSGFSGLALWPRWVQSGRRGRIQWEDYCQTRWLQTLMTLSPISEAYISPLSYIPAVKEPYCKEYVFYIWCSRQIYEDWYLQTLQCENNCGKEYVHNHSRFKCPLLPAPVLTGVRRPSTESRAPLSGGADGREVDSKVSGRRGEIKVVERGQMEVWEYLILMFVFM